MGAVSVIIPTYNQARYLGEAIESALTQTDLPGEVIVVDDGSTDETPYIIAKFGVAIRHLRQTNQGVAAARNAGARLANGTWLAFLDSDDRWLPRKLERQKARFGTEPGIGLVHCGVEEIDASGRPLGTHLNGLEGRVAHEMLLFRRSVVLGGGSGSMIPRTIFSEVGGFDERLSTSADWDLYYRIAARYRIGFVAEILLQYRLHGANMHSNVRTMEHDMLCAYVKAFADANHRPPVSPRICYGNLHSVLSGGFFATGDYGRFASHALKSLWLTPGNITRYLGYPLRLWRRAAGGASETGIAGQSEKRSEG